jgi:hypothetical protein
MTDLDLFIPVEGPPKLPRRHSDPIVVLLVHTLGEENESDDDDKTADTIESEASSLEEEERTELLFRGSCDA